MQVIFSAAGHLARFAVAQSSERFNLPQTSLPSRPSPIVQ
jgi:hypothetical protein